MTVSAASRYLCAIMDFKAERVSTRREYNQLVGGSRPV
jgi:hypothetical protein